MGSQQLLNRIGEAVLENQVQHLRLVCSDPEVWTYDHVENELCVLRSTIVRLIDGNLLVYSPAKEMPEAAHAQLLELGQPSVLIAPNHYHHLGLDLFQARYPLAKVVASAVAAKRLQDQVSAGIHSPLAIRHYWPAPVSLMQLPAARSGELWLRIQHGGANPTGVTWVLGDAYLNVPRTPPTHAGKLMRLAGAVPGLRISQPFKWSVLSDRAMYRDWLYEQLRTDEPNCMIPCHGDIDNNADLTDRLWNVLQNRLE